jgi:hypothetical protein
MRYTRGYPLARWIELLREATVHIAIIVLAGSTAFAGAHSFHYDTNLGVASQRADTVCLSISNRHLDEGQVVSLVVLAPQQVIAQAKVVRVLTTDCMGADAAQSTVASYEVKMVQGSLQPGTPAIAVVNPAKPLRLSGGAVVGDLDGNGQLEYFRQCTSSEGVHLTVWTGKPLAGKRRWHDYYYLGYDVEPNCTDAEVVAETHP